MSLNSSNRYDDIINLPRPESKHPHMSNADRAKIFSPFAALKGHTEAIRQKEILRVNKIVLSDEAAAALNEKLTLLEKGRMTTITYFFSDPGPDGSGGTAEGMYVTLSGIIKRLDSISRILEIDDYKINFDDIADITSDTFPRQDANTEFPYFQK